MPKDNLDLQAKMGNLGTGGPVGLQEKLAARETEGNQVSLDHREIGGREDQLVKLEEEEIQGSQALQDQQV